MFRDPIWLLVLAAACGACAALAWLGARRREGVSAALGHVDTLQRLLAPELPTRRAWKTGLRLTSLALLFVALAGPQWGVELVQTQSSARVVMIAVDVSLSMLTDDVKPSRLERAKADMAILLDQLKGVRAGVIAFAGEPAVVCPVTGDLEAAKQVLRGLKTGMVPVPGTGIGKAIRLATATLSRYPGQRALIILSDGEDHKTDPEGAADEAAGRGIRVYSIGVGTPEGAPIPLREESGALTGYKKDRRGATVISRLGERTLADAAARASGAYYRSSAAGNEAADIADQIDRQAAGEFSATSSRSFKNRFQLPLAAAFLALLLELLLPERKGIAADLGLRARRVLRPVSSLALLLLLGGGGARAATAESALRRGNALYEKEHYEPALEQYALAGQKRPRDPRPAFNAGDALYRLKQYDQSAQAFASIALSSAPAPLRAEAFYNLGNSRFGAGDDAGAVAAFRAAVTLRPDDEAARRNLAIALRRQKDPRKTKQARDQKRDQSDKDRPRQNQSKQSPSQGQPPQPRTRPQDQISREDAQRIMRAVSERERTAQLRLQKQAPQKKLDVEEDW